MAVRQWIEPQDVKDYTEYPVVANREDKKLLVDISRAETYIISYTNNKFENELPEAVKIATILIAEAYAYNSANSSKGGIKSETFDDYSYTLSETPEIDLNELELGTLLCEFMQEKQKGNVTAKLRKL